jgi:protein gp37
VSEHTEIAWCDHTFNPWWGCSKVSEGCKNCYAERVSARFGGDHWGDGKQRRTFGTKHWLEPLKWSARVTKTGIRERVFSGSMCDIFDGIADPIERMNLFRLIARTPGLDWLLLTKRPEYIRAMLHPSWLSNPMPNVWFGATVENAARRDRILNLVQVPATVRFLSCEPLLGDLGRVNLKGIHWVIAGAESGPWARPMSEDWVRSLRDQCQAQGVAFFYKQRIENGRKISTPELDGRRWVEFPTS